MCEQTDTQTDIHTVVYTDTGLQTETHTPITVGSAVLALASIPALRQRLLCLSAPASCNLSVCEWVCVCICLCQFIAVDMCGWERQKEKNVNNLLISFMHHVNMKMLISLLSRNLTLCHISLLSVFHCCAKLAAMQSHTNTPGSVEEKVFCALTLTS